MATDIYTNASQDATNREEYMVIGLINAYRHENGVAALQVGKTLSLVAGRKALDRYENVTTYPHGNFGENSAHGWSDQPYNGNDPGTAGAIYDGARKFGISYDVSGEVTTANIIDLVSFKISDSVQGDIAVERWKNSPPHNALLLNPDFAQIGVGIVGGVAYAVFSYWSDPLGPADIVVDYSSFHLDGTPHGDRFVISGDIGSVNGNESDDIFLIDVQYVRSVAIGGGGGNDIVRLNIDKADTAITSAVWGAGENTYSLSGNHIDYRFDDVELVQFNDGNLALGAANNYAFLHRLYDAMFDRTPDEGGFNYWANRLLDGSIGRYDLAGYFTASDEFRRLYGENTSNNGFVDALYHNIFSRDSDQGGKQYWTSRLDEGYDRSSIVNGFVESNEHKALTYDQIAYGLWFS